MLNKIKFLYQNLKEKFKDVWIAPTISQVFHMSSACDTTGVKSVVHPLLSCRQSSSLDFLCYVQICIAVGVFLANSLTNARCTVLFYCIPAYSNSQITFSFPVNDISILKRKNKTLNIKQNLELF